MAHICRNTRRQSDIVQAQTRDERVELEKEGKRLSDASACAEDGDFSLSGDRG